MFEKFFLYICNTMALPNKILTTGQKFIRCGIATVECMLFGLCSLRLNKIPCAIANILNFVLFTISFFA